MDCRFLAARVAGVVDDVRSEEQAARRRHISRTNVNEYAFTGHRTGQKEVERLVLTRRSGLLPMNNRCMKINHLLGLMS